MKVKTLKAHNNQFGDTYAKKKGDVYEHPSPAADIEFKYVEEVKDPEPAADKEPSKTNKLDNSKKD